MSEQNESSVKKLNWGILGAARVNERLMPAIVEARNSQLVAIASRRKNASAECIASYAPNVQNVATYDNLQSLLQDSNVHAVYIPLSNHEHAEWALRAIEHGKHVLIEKPMALTVTDIKLIERAAKVHNIKVMEGFMYRFHPQHSRVREIVDSGVIGEVRNTHASFSFMMRPSRIYRLAETVSKGGGAMWDIGPYAVHTSRMWFNELPKSVLAIADYSESGADVTTTGIINYGDGKFSQFDVSFERTRQSEYTIVGTKGVIKCHNTWQLPSDEPVISWWTEDGKIIEERLLAANHFNLEIEHFSDCVLSNKAPLLSFADAKANCELIEAILHSAASGKVVSLSGN
ncbi:Gfo/Idh/MocA family protein [Methylotenera sp.]|uniref:Gfo/Idh/MocA family protein n=1 Tax=Methylotenera sp. TaxID=2051956 RepID=UPI0027352850|nr:Gfo/Idh/MocA family oxidoreductase [Methylotenera sp.]MDP3777665.1 Gfo/Idh/MocA family oxidoreductase [Methylotenera sp.]